MTTCQLEERVKQLKIQDETADKESSAEEEEIEDQDSDEFDDELEGVDWSGERGDFTKKLKKMSAQAAGNANHGLVAGKEEGALKAVKVETRNSRLLARINVNKYDGPPIKEHTVKNALINSTKSLDQARCYIKDKSDRATVEMAIDRRTRMVLMKLISRGVVTRINGCVSTGKEANVYHATTTSDKPDCAVKVYKTSILTFKDRDRYVTGEFRFRHGYCKRNPRKMVAMWAEKELRNLIRLQTGGLPVPTPIALRGNVLVMEFLGVNGWPSPLLKEVSLSDSRWRELYTDMVRNMRILYQKCKLVHADLSEYNLIFHKNKIFIIDVSQSVEHDHPNALDFLRSDCSNITSFFEKHGVAVMNVRQLFDFITDPTISDESIDEYLDKMMEVLSESLKVEGNDGNQVLFENQSKIDAAVFRNVYIPRTLGEVTTYEEDIPTLVPTVNPACTDQAPTDKYYATVTGQKSDFTGPLLKPALLNSDSEHSDDEKSEGDMEVGSEEEESEEEDSDDDLSFSDRADRLGPKPTEGRPRDESPNSRKLRKQQVKEEKRQKRAEKVPKHVKKRREKAAKGNAKKR